MSLQTTQNPLPLAELKYQRKSDAELVRLCQNHDSAAFNELLKRHQRTVHSMLYKLAPDWTENADLVQEVSIRIWRGIHLLKNANSFKSWLRQIVTNIFYDELRKRCRQPYSLSLDEPFDNGEDEDTGTRDLVDPSAGPDQICLRKELNARVQKAMTALPINFRMAVELRDLKGLTYDEISALTKTEIGTVKSRISRGRAQVQAILTPYLRSNDLPLSA